MLTEDLDLCKQEDNDIRTISDYIRRIYNGFMNLGYPPEAAADFVKDQIVSATGVAKDAISVYTLDSIAATYADALKRALKSIADELMPEKPESTRASPIEYKKGTEAARAHSH